MKINGKITDIDGVPLALANITMIGSGAAGKYGIVADVDGNFSADSTTITPESQFVVSYMGFVSQTLKAADLVNAKIKLLENIETLDEVVVTGGVPKPKKETKTTSKLALHLNKNKVTYAGIGGLLGFILIVTSFKR